MATTTYCPEFEGLNVVPLIFLPQIAQTRTATVTLIPHCSKVRYRYPGEDWQEIEGDAYELNQDFPPEEGNVFNWHWLEFDATVKGRYPPISTIPAKLNDGDEIVVRVTGSFSGNLKVQGYDSSSTNWAVIFDYTVKSQNTCYKAQTARTLFYGGKSVRTTASTATNPGVVNIRNPRLVVDEARASITCPVVNNDCQFVVSLCGDIVHEEIRDVCPEVELLSCELDFTKTTIEQITLNPFDLLYVTVGSGGIVGTALELLLEAITVALYNFPLGNSLFQELAQLLDSLITGNPDNCVLITVLRNLSYPEHIRQFCSSCNCSPPEVEVNCFDKDCPPDTCQIDCGDHYCCYNSEGIAVLSLPK